VATAVTPKSTNIGTISTAAAAAEGKEQRSTDIDSHRSVFLRGANTNIQLQCALEGISR
jgi:hypothetical protein